MGTTKRGKLMLSHASSDPSALAHSNFSDLTVSVGPERVK